MFDIENTWAAKTIKSRKDAGNKVGDKHALEPDNFPNDAKGQLDHLRQIAALPGKEQITIRNMTRQVVRERDSKGRLVPHEYLTYRAEFRKENAKGVPYATDFEVGKYNESLTVPNPNQRYDSKTGQALESEEIVSGQKPVYFIELTDKNRKQTIDKIIDIDSSNYPENIQFYYKDTDRGFRDPTFTYDDFVSKSIDELKDLSYKGGGSKTPGFWRDKDGVLRNRDGSPVK
jgi:hypothetical protein